MRKSTWLATLVTTLILTLAAPAYAVVKVQFNGQPLVFDVPPVNENGRLLVPVRAIFEALGARITWDPASQTVSAVHPERDKYVILTLGSTTAWVDGHQTTLDVAPKSIDGRTMVPLRFISTAMGADVSYDAATQTASISQEPILAQEPTVSHAETTEPTPPTPDADDPQLSRFTRQVAKTHLDETYACSMRMEYRFEEMEYVFVTGDAAALAEYAPYLQQTLDCWTAYEQEILPTLNVPAGAKDAYAALQLWVDMNQKALLQLQASVEGHRKGDQAERDRLFREGREVLKAAFTQEERMMAAMNAIKSNYSQFLTVDEHVYVKWLDDFMGLTDNCFSELWMIRLVEEGDAQYAKGAAACMVELPDTLKEKAPPTVRMQKLLDGVLAELAIHSKNFTAFSAELQAGPLDEATLDARIEAIGEAWFAARPTFDQLFVYRDYGEELPD